MDENCFACDRAAIRAELELWAPAELFITHGEATGMVGRESLGAEGPL